MGVHWARWNDAVREAGFAPNELNSAYTEEELLERLAALTTELGRLPTRGDLRFRESRDPEFPNSKTFLRLGVKAERLQALAEYSRTRPAYELVARLCDNELSTAKPVSAAKSAPGTAVAFVYLAKSGRHYKIGRTSALGRREYELGLQLPERTKVVHVIRTDDAVGIEAYWHKRFEDKRGNGEWFALDTSDVSAFKRRKFM